jgi:hypothetical protein
MNVNIQIHYLSESGNKVLQKGSFPLRRRKKEEVALGFWQQIKREHPLEVYLEQVLIDLEDCTEEIKRLEAPLNE